MAESKLVTKLKALPMREMRIWVEMTLMDTPIYEVSTMSGLTTERVTEILHETNIRLGLEHE